MSRIRSIKPEFWASEQVMECSPLARLAFIGMWNFCDDQGVHPASPKTLRAEIFPSDDISPHQIAGLVAELVAQGLLREFQAEGKSWWHVTGWHHQKIDRPSKSKYPSPITSYNKNPPPDGDGVSTESRLELDEDSTRTRRGLATEGRGREGKGEERKVVVVDCSALSARDGAPIQKKTTTTTTANFSVEDVAMIYHEICAHLPRCNIEIATEARDHIEVLLRAEKPGRHPEKWRSFFEYVTESDLLMGRKPGRNGLRDWGADLFWLVKPNNFAKVCSGKYHDGANHG